MIGTKLRFAFVYHPQSSGAVERANGQIFSGIKKCLFDQKKGWADELSKVIWSHNTTELELPNSLHSDCYMELKLCAQKN
jgi:hypothetical protein